MRTKVECHVCGKIHEFAGVVLQVGNLGISVNGLPYRACSGHTQQEIRKAYLKKMARKGGR